jgi:hypothetical protein
MVDFVELSTEPLVWKPLVWNETADTKIRPPEGPLLVRLPASGGYHYHVAIKSDGMWRMFGATDRMIYGVEAWAEIPQ